jgi:hypothetical protein
MARLTSVPGWVRPPVRAVASVEDYLLRLYGRTRSAEALGGHAALAWLGGVDGGATVGPLVWRAAPDHVELVWSFLAVADVLAEGEPYPSASWWRERRGIGPMSPLQWAKRAESWVERQYAHGVTCALGWVLGEIDDPALMAPLHDGAGAVIPFAEREEYRIRLRACALPDGARAGDLGSWPPVARVR